MPLESRAISPFSKGLTDGLRLAGCGALFVIPFGMLAVWGTHPVPFLTGKTTIFHYAVLAAAAMGACIMALQKRHPSSIIAVFALLIAAMALADMHATEVHSAVWGTLFRQEGLVGLLALLAFLVAFDGLSPGGWLIRAWAVSSTGAALTGIFQAVVTGGTERVWGVLGQPVFLGAFVGLGMIFSAWAFSKSRTKPLWAMAMAVQMAAIFLTADRSVLIALLAASLIGAWWDRKFLLASPVFGGLLAYFSLWNPFPQIEAAHYDAARRTMGVPLASISWRLHCWQGDWAFIRLRPLLGYGQENTNILCGPEAWDRAHNFVLQYLLDGGILALTAFLFFIVCAAMKMVSLEVAFPLMVLGAYIVIVSLEPDSLVTQLPMLTAVGFAWRGA